MHLHELFESTNADLATLRNAQRICGQFMRWLADHNETVPVKDLGLWHRRVGPCDVWMEQAQFFGIDLADVYLGLGRTLDPADRAQAFATSGRDQGRPIAFLIMLMDGDIADATDVAWGLNWSHFIHELCHVLDYSRGYQRHRDNLARKYDKLGKPQPNARTHPNQYLNSAVEFNAYYMQGMNDILSMLAREAISNRNKPRSVTAYQEQTLGSYKSFCNATLFYFAPHWINGLQPRMRRKFERRFAQFYQLVKATWPDMAAIRDIEQENQARAKELDRREQQEIADESV